MTSYSKSHSSEGCDWGYKSSGNYSPGNTSSYTSGNKSSYAPYQSTGYPDYGSRSKGSYDKSSYNKSGYKSDGHKSTYHKKQECHSQAHCILKKIGIGTPNIRIVFNGKVRVGVFLGIFGGCASINSRGVVSFIQLSAITAVDIGVRVKRKKKYKCKCKKIR